MAGETMTVSIESLAQMQAARVLRERQRIAEEIRDEAALNLGAGKTEYALLLDRLAERIAGAPQKAAASEAPVLAVPEPDSEPIAPEDYRLPDVHLNDDETDASNLLGNLHARAALMQRAGMSAGYMRD